MLTTGARRGAAVFSLSRGSGLKFRRVLRCICQRLVLPLTREWIEMPCLSIKDKGIKFSLSRGSGLKYTLLLRIPAPCPSSPSHEGVD